MKIYDMHVHAETCIAEPNKLIENMEKAGVYGGTVISVRPEESYGRFKLNYEERIKNVIDWTKGYEDRLFPVLWIHPREENAIEKVKDAVDKGISAFKMICDNYYVYDDISMKLIEAIAKTGKPLMFHSGILWIGKAIAADYNRPANWEHLLEIPNIRFSLAHCSWPWYDECIAIYGRMEAARRFDPQSTPDMYLDLTPGTPKIYREDLLNKLFNIGYNPMSKMMFGSDMGANDYELGPVKDWIDYDNAIYDKLGVADDIRKKIYADNFLTFIGAK
mgnify:CR=1 FL=1